MVFGAETEPVEGDTTDEEGNDKIRDEELDANNHNRPRWPPSSDESEDKLLASSLKLSFRGDVEALSFEVTNYAKMMESEKTKSLARDAMLKGIKTEIDLFRSSLRQVQVERVNFPAMKLSIENLKSKMEAWEEFAEEKAFKAINEVASAFKDTIAKASIASWETKQEVIYLHERLDTIERKLNILPMGRGGLSGRARFRGGKAIRPGRAETEKIVRTRLMVAPVVGAYGFENEPESEREHLTKNKKAYEARAVLEAEGQGTIDGPGKCQELKRSLSQTRLERSLGAASEAVEGIKVLSLDEDQSKKMKMSENNVTHEFSNLDHDKSSDDHLRVRIPESQGDDFTRSNQIEERGRKSTRGGSRSRSLSNKFPDNVSSGSSRDRSKTTNSAAKSVQKDPGAKDWVHVKSGKCFGEFIKTLL